MSGELIQIIPSESVTPGHPDKVADYIAAHGLDIAEQESQKKGGHVRMGAEVMVKGDMEHGGTVILSGEVTTASDAGFDPAKSAIEAIKNLGYTDPAAGFSDKSEIIMRITRQSADIDRGVTKQGSKEVGYGDQGIFIGGAIAGDGPNNMPMPLMIARRLTDGMFSAFKTHELPFLRPDGKSQVGVQYVNGVPKRIDNITLAASHDPLAELGYVQQQLRERIIDPVCDEFHLGIDKDTKIIINGAGKWTIYGPLGDAGLTNRKIVIDTYGGGFKIGGGGLNGKDATKADVTLQVAARWAALLLVRNNLAKKAEVRIACTIGQTEIDSLDVDSFGTGAFRDDELAEFVQVQADFSIGSLIERFRMYDQMYGPLALHGWFGKPDRPWEQVPEISVLTRLDLRNYRR